MNNNTKKNVKVSEEEEGNLNNINLEDLDLDNSKIEQNMKKIRKKRKPLSVAATKNMNKNSYHVLLNFD